MPNKFLIETALDIWIANLEKSRNTDPKKLYEEVKAAIKSETSEEMKSLYRRYIELYDTSIKSTNAKSTTLSKEIKWKNFSDLKKAISNNLIWLSPADIEGLNQFAVAEYATQTRSSNYTYWDNQEILSILNTWFRFYNNQSVQKPREELSDMKSAFVKGLINSDRLPFKFDYNWKNLNVSSINNSLIIGDKQYSLNATNLTIKSIKIDKDNILIDIQDNNQCNLIVKARMSKQEFVDKYLDAILAWDPIQLHQSDVKVTILPTTVPPSPAPSIPAPSSVPSRTPPPSAAPQATSPKKGPVDRVPKTQQDWGLKKQKESPSENNIVWLSASIVSFRKVIAENANKVGRLTPTYDSTIESSRKVIVWAISSIEAELKKINPNKLSSTDKTLYDKYVLELAQYLADEHTVYNSIWTKNRYWKNYDKSLAMSAGLLSEDFKAWKINIPKPPTDRDLRSAIKTYDADLAKKIETLFAQWYSWWDIISNPKIRSAWNEVNEKVYWNYNTAVSAAINTAITGYKNGTLTFKNDQEGTRANALRLMDDVIGAGRWKLWAKSWDTARDTWLLIWSALAWWVATVMTGGLAWIAFGATIATTWAILTKWQLSDSYYGTKDIGFEFLLNGITFW
jgi:hypothetical protein